MLFQLVGQGFDLRATSPVDLHADGRGWLDVGQLARQLPPRVRIARMESLREPQLSDPARWFAEIRRGETHHRSFFRQRQDSRTLLRSSLRDLQNRVATAPAPPSYLDDIAGLERVERLERPLPALPFHP